MALIPWTYNPIWIPMDLKPRQSPTATVIRTDAGWQLGIPAGSARHYRLAQVDDQAGLPRSAYPWRPPLTMSVRARISAPSTPGTWGFGLWNDPYGFSFGPGSSFLRLPALPQTAWFFCASARNYLSFRDDKPAHGFLAQSFCSPRFSTGLLPAGLTLPFARKAARHMLSRVIHEDSAQIDLDRLAWHDYRLEWTDARAVFWVDSAEVLESQVSPLPPLGLVFWIDNQYAAFGPDGRIRWGVEENPTELWLDVRGIHLSA